MATSKINGIHRYGESIYASSRAYCPGEQAYFNYIYRRHIDASYEKMYYMLASDTRPRFSDFEKFTFVVDGESKMAYTNNRGYIWGVDNPPIGPVVSAGAAGSPSGTYQCYVTFYVVFGENEKVVETGPSPVGAVTVTSQKISWARIPICRFVGDEITIYRRLWRTVSGDPYLVTTIRDNYTTTFTDNVTDAVLQVSTALGTEGYSTLPSGQGVVDLAEYLKRMFAIKENKLYWSEPYSPFSFKTTSNVTVSKDFENLVGIINWGDQMYMVSAEEWYRLQGSDPTTWAIKRTFTDNGIINRHTMAKTRYGIVGLWNDGIYLFDGNTTKNITDKILGKEFFQDLDDSTVCWSTFDGMRYWFYYASSGSTIDSCVILDFSLHPEYRVYHDNWVADAHEFHKVSNHHYLAKNGYEYSEGGTETIPTIMTSGDRAFGAITKRKCLRYLYYDIDTNGKDVTISILVDGTSVQELTLNTSTRQWQRSEQLIASEGYRFGVQVECADSQDLRIYAPWALEADPVGE